ncbi:hypothetical protein G6F68_019085 [Rhizopus microsporus]|nr:hypothetical protein G6F68_019085 [Rhizopus microsporus]
MPGHPASQATAQARSGRKAVIAASAGNALEWYDFTVYALPDRAVDGLVPGVRAGLRGSATGCAGAGLLWRPRRPQSRADPDHHADGRRHAADRGCPALRRHWRGRPAAHRLRPRAAGLFGRRRSRRRHRLPRRARP